MLKLLFTPIRVGKMELKNRIVMPAMHFLSSWDGFVLPHHTDYFVERARGEPRSSSSGAAPSTRPAAP